MHDVLLFRWALFARCALDHQNVYDADYNKQRHMRSYTAGCRETLDRCG